MKTSTTHSNDSRSLCRRFARLAMALAFGGLLCTFPVQSAWAAHHHGGWHHAYPSGWHGGWGWGPNYYYTPAPDYYVAPEPYEYYGPEYPEPSEGLNLFFHF